MRFRLLIVLAVLSGADCSHVSGCLASDGILIAESLDENNDLIQLNRQSMDEGSLHHISDAVAPVENNSTLYALKSALGIIGSNRSSLNKSSRPSKGNDSQQLAGTAIEASKPYVKVAGAAAKKLKKFLKRKSVKKVLTHPKGKTLTIPVGKQFKVVSSKSSKAKGSKSVTIPVGNTLRISSRHVSAKKASATAAKKRHWLAKTAAATAAKQHPGVKITITNNHKVAKATKKNTAKTKAQKKAHTTVKKTSQKKAHTTVKKKAKKKAHPTVTKKAKKKAHIIVKKEAKKKAHIIVKKKASIKKAVKASVKKAIKAATHSTTKVIKTSKKKWSTKASGGIIIHPIKIIIPHRTKHHYKVTVNKKKSR